MATRGYEGVKASDLAKHVLPKPSKYRNVKIAMDGHTFDSKREAAFYQELKAQQAAGLIRDLQLQVPFSLFTPVIGVDSCNACVATYVADFVYEEAIRDVGGAMTWQRVVADCKGGRNTQMFALKKKWLELQSGIQIRELR